MKVHIFLKIIFTLLLIACTTLIERNDFLGIPFIIDFLFSIIYRFSYVPFFLFQIMSIVYIINKNKRTEILLCILNLILFWTGITLNVDLKGNLFATVALAICSLIIFSYSVLAYLNYKKSLQSTNDTLDAH